jgi:hypothetical protein
LEGFAVAQSPSEHQVQHYQYPNVAQPFVRVPQEYNSATQLYEYTASTSNAVASGSGSSRNAYRQPHKHNQSRGQIPIFGLRFAQDNARFSLLDDDGHHPRPLQEEGEDFDRNPTVLPILSRNLFNTSNLPEMRSSRAPRFGTPLLDTLAGTGIRQTAHETWMKTLWTNGEMFRMHKLTRTIDSDDLEGFFPNIEQRHQVRLGSPQFDFQSKRLMLIVHVSRTITVQALYNAYLQYHFDHPDDSGVQPLAEFLRPSRSIIPARRVPYMRRFPSRYPKSGHFRHRLPHGKSARRGCQTERQCHVRAKQGSAEQGFGATEGRHHRGTSRTGKGRIGRHGHDLRSGVDAVHPRCRCIVARSRSYGFAPLINGCVIRCAIETCGVDRME